jgi:hypothetical protein
MCLVTRDMQTTLMTILDFRRARSFVLAAGLAAAASASRADFVEYSSTIASAYTPFSTTFEVQKFDSSLGLLTSITLSLSSTIVGEIDVFNSTTAPQPFTSAFASVPVSVTTATPNITSVSATATALLASGVAAPGFNAYPGISGSGTGSTIVAPSDFFYYVGLGSGMANFVAASTTGTFGGTSVPGVYFSGAALADGLFTIRYDYNVPAVPLPPAGWLFAAGLVGIAGFIRRRPLPEGAIPPVV